MCWERSTSRAHFVMEDNTSMSVLKATALAGGTTKLASLKDSLILRKSPQGHGADQVSLDKIYHGKAPRPAAACGRYRVRSAEQRKELRSHGAARRDSGRRLLRIRCRGALTTMLCEERQLS